MRTLSVFFDLESTGLSTERDSIVQIYAKAYQGNFLRAISGFHAFVHPRRPIPWAASKVHGIYVSKQGLLYHKPPGSPKDQKPKFLPEARDFGQVAPLFANWLRKLLDHTGSTTLVFCGHNIVSYDIPLLIKELERAPCRPVIRGVKIKVADTLRLCRANLKNTNKEKGFYKLEKLHSFLFHQSISDGVGLPAHDARADVLANVRVAASLPSVKSSCLHGAEDMPIAQRAFSQGRDWACSKCGTKCSKWFTHSCL
jgi:DNA polymerase III epsilon subunit-like protein